MRIVRAVALGTCAFFATVLPAHAQALGRVLGVVVNSRNVPLAGVGVQLEGSGLSQPILATTTTSGAFEFPRVPVGIYSLTARLKGFADAVRRRVDVRDGRASTVDLTVEAAGVRDGRFDAGAAALDTTIDRAVMLNVPTARDPWQIMKLAPGVMLSGVNVAGSASGQQLTPQAFGSSANVQWHVNGGATTDMSSNSSPTYYNFDSLDAVQVVTGGGDVSVASAGLFINLLTKSGTNVLSGSATTTFAGSALQSQNVSQTVFASGELAGGPASPLHRINTSSGEIGGAIRRDRLWFWGATDYQSIDVASAHFIDTTRAGCNPPPTTFDQLSAAQACLASDKTTIEDFNAKLTGRPSAAQTLAFLVQTSQKLRNNRATTQTDVSSTQSQYNGSHAFSASPTVQLTHTWQATNRLGLLNQLTHVDNGFFLDFHDYATCGPSTYARDQAGNDPIDPSCGWNTQALTNRTTGATTRAPNAAAYQTSRPSWEVRTDDHYLLPHVLGGDHAFRFGAGWRKDPVLSYSHQGGGAIATVQCENDVLFNCGNNFVPIRSGPGLVPYQAQVWRDGLTNYDWQTFNWYAQDTYATHRLTVTGGMRWDRQSSMFLGGCVSANVVNPTLLPQRCQSAVDPGVPLATFAPRIAATYDLTGEGRLTIHGSVAYYRASNVVLATLLNPLRRVGLTYGPNASSGACQNFSCWTDANHDGIAQGNELTGSPTATSNLLADGTLGGNLLPNIDPALQPSRTREAIVGAEGEIGRTLHAAVTFVYRYNDLGSATYAISGLDETPTQFVSDETNLWQRHIFADQSGITAPYYTLCSGCSLFSSLGGTVITTNLAHTTDVGVTTSLAKRLANHWQGEVSYTWNDARVFTPTGTFSTTGAVGNPTGVEFTNGFTNGTPPHDLKAFGHIELPHGFTAGLNVNVRSGDVRILTIDGPGAVNGATYNTLTFQPAGTTRTPVTSLLDLSVAKSLRLGRTTLTLTVDCFNALNAATPLTYMSNNISNDVGALPLAPFSPLSTIVPPRVFRLDVRFSF